MKPKVLVVEEAGQLLKPHILASLVQSVQQVIMIGDPLQLRPNISNSSSLFKNKPASIQLTPIVDVRTFCGESDNWAYISS